MKVEPVQGGQPSYFGSKLFQIRAIMAEFAKNIPRDRWPNLTCIDAFSGGGSVSLFLKTQGVKAVIANDLSDLSRLIAQAFLINQKIRLERVDILYMLQPLPAGMGPGLVETQYCPGVFSRRHARVLDRCLFWAQQLLDPTKHALSLVLIWHLVYAFHCFPTSLGGSNRPFAEALDGVRSWDTINPKRFVDGSLKSLLKPTPLLLEEKRIIVNRGVYGGSPVSFHQQDALTFLQSVAGDVAFLDPPYAGTLRYHQSYALLHELFFGEKPSPPPTDFSSSVEALNALLDSAQHIPHWILAYGNKEIDLDGLIQLVQRHAGARKVTGIAKAYAHLPHVAKRKNNQELVILAIQP